MSLYAGDELHGDDVTSGPSTSDSCPSCWAFLDTEPHARGCPEAPGGPHDTDWNPDA